MQKNVAAAREIAEAWAPEYSSTLWAGVPITEGPRGPYVRYPDIVGAAVVGREAAFLSAGDDVRRLASPEFDTVAVAVLTAWFLDFTFFRSSLTRMPVARLFGPDPVPVAEEMVVRLSVAGAQFLCGYEETDPDKRVAAVPFAALSIKESMWGGPLPEEWIA